MRSWNDQHAPRFLVLLSLLSLGLASEYDHKYEEGDRIGVWAARAGPLSKPFEAYNMYDLPYCRPEGITMNFAKKEAFLGEEIMFLRRYSVTKNFISLKTWRLRLPIPQATLYRDATWKIQGSSCALTSPYLDRSCAHLIPQQGKKNALWKRRMIDGYLPCTLMTCPSEASLGHPWSRTQLR
mmetsp:Transcript_24633/g.97269  ORF Transcript_24633/g.97269 Transcript_24633/m.97269 type:complete len:182 (+) Transcript_24633:396-941(+)